MSPEASEPYHIIMKLRTDELSVWFSRGSTNSTGCLQKMRIFGLGTF